ncbi:MAG: dihydroxy-acid dehydratase, partial [Flavobacteriales bacterium]
ITINAETNTISLELSEKELQERKKSWTAPQLKFKKGILYKYAKSVSSASKGCVTDEF